MEIYFFQKGYYSFKWKMQILIQETFLVSEKIQNDWILKATCHRNQDVMQEYTNSIIASRYIVSYTPHPPQFTHTCLTWGSFHVIHDCIHMIFHIKVLLWNLWSPVTWNIWRVPTFTLSRRNILLTAIQITATRLFTITYIYFSL